jgi:HK97 family phage prohead protease
MDFSTRQAPFHITRAEPNDAGDGLTLEGYAAVFDSPTLIRERGVEFHERIAPGAFAESLRGRTPKLQFDHGAHPLVGSLPIGQVREIREDGHGLYVKARLHDNWLTQPVRDAIESGSVDGMSFRFAVNDGGDTWDRSGELPTRTLTSVALYEIGPVVFPAYSDTAVAVRSRLESLPDVERAEALDAFRAAFAEGVAPAADTETEGVALVEVPAHLTIQARRKRALQLRGVTP